MNIELMASVLLLVLVGAVVVVLWYGGQPSSALHAAERDETEDAAAYPREDIALIASHLSLVEGHVRAIKWLLAVLLIAIGVMHVLAVVLMLPS